MSAPSAPAFLAKRVRRMASRVLLEPVPGMTLMRPAARSQTAAMTRSCSSWSKVGDSPVVPTGARQSVPCSTCQSTSFRRAGKSTWPSRNGVTSATVRPANSSPLVAMAVRYGGAPRLLVPTDSRTLMLFYVPTRAQYTMADDDAKGKPPHGTDKRGPRRVRGGVPGRGGGRCHRLGGGDLPPGHRHTVLGRRDGSRGRAPCGYGLA